MIITADQIRAARALKNWSQSELAERVGMATPSIGNIEVGKHAPTRQTQEAIREVFESAGVEFIEGGVRKKQDLIRIYEGEECYLKLLDDVFQELASSKDEVLFSGSDEGRSTPQVIEKLRAIRRIGIPMRSLIRKGDTLIMGPLKEYRWMPDIVYEESDVKVVFSDMVAYLISWQDIWKVIVLKSEPIANEARRHFEFVWSLAEAPQKSTSSETY